MHALWKDSRHAVRALLKTPAYTVVALVTLALGIGANTAIFSVVNQVLLNPAGISNPGRIVALRVNYDKLRYRACSPEPACAAMGTESTTVSAYRKLVAKVANELPVTALAPRRAGLTELRLAPAACLSAIMAGGDAGCR